MGRGRNKSAKVWRAKVARVAKNVALRAQETKQITLDIFPTTVYKDGGATSGQTTPFTVYPLRNVIQGTSNDDMIGDQITLKGINLRLNWRNSSASQTVSYVRVMVGWINPNVTTIGQNWRMGTAGDAVSAFLRRPSDADAIWKKVLVDRIYSVKSILTGVDNMGLMNIQVPLHNRKYEFSETTPFAGVHDDLVILVTCSSPGGVTLTTGVGVIDGFVRFWYKDA